MKGYIAFWLQKRYKGHIKRVYEVVGKKDYNDCSREKKRITASKQMESSKEAVWAQPGNYKLLLEDTAFTADGSFPVRRWKPEQEYVHAENCTECA